MTDSQRLLAEYAANGSEMAFRELVSRYVDLVYSVALRSVAGDKHLAEDIAQTVFADLARAARTLSKGVMLGGWLHRHTCFVVAKTLRGERRRQIRERQAAEMNIPDHSEANLAHLAPILDEAINKLGEDDRTAILLRFFEQQDFRAVGEALGSNEDAARMRVTRALEKLHALLKHRGVTLSAAAFGTALASEAVTAAPAGLAVSISGAALLSAAGTGTTLTVLKIMAMTKVQLGVTAIIITGAAICLIVQHDNQMALREQNRSLQQQVTQLQTDNETLSNHFVQAKSVLKLNLPAPRLQFQAQPSEPDLRATNLIARLQGGEKAPTLTPAQAEKFLDENHRNASSLLAAFRATGDQKLLKEATEKYPDDPQVAFTAAYAPDVSLEERRHWLDALKQSSPENSLADYLSAADHFKSGQMDQAVQDMSAAYSKKSYQDYSWDFIQSGQEAYRAAGYSEAEARIIPSMSLLLPQFAELKEVNNQMINLAKAYQQAGDESSAQAALQMDLILGQHLTAPGNASLLSQLVGMSIESSALRQMDASAPYGSDGQTVRQRLDEIMQKRTEMTEFGKQLDQIYTTISPSDWISYHDRWLAFGEQNAAKWLLNKYGQK
jgi:RNA polymerase sigma factor (sigma-70 family)